MARFGQRAPTMAETAQYVPAPRALRVLRADGQRIDLRSRTSAAQVAATRQSWQTAAWSYRDLIGELRYANRLLAQGVAQVRFYAAQDRPWPEDPAPLDGDEHDLDAQLAADAVHNFSRIPLTADPDGFTARLTENLATPGEGWVHIDPDGQFYVRSISEITASSDGKVMLAAMPGGGMSSGARVIDPEAEDLVRCWIPHPEWGQLADSPMRSLLDVAEDAVLAGREARAAARSRIAANGLLLVPTALSLLTARDQDDDDPAEDVFMADLAAAMLAPISDDGDAGAVVPIVIRGDSEDLEKVRHLTLQRETGAALIERQSTALLRLLRGLDVQPEQVEGVGGMSHWSGWLVEAQSVKHQIKPMAQTVAACLAAGYLRATLLDLGHDPREVAKVTIGVDVSPLSENPNRGQDARDAHGAMVISDDKLREALGFDEDDKPAEDEVLRRLAIGGRLPPELTAQVLGLQQPQRQTITVDAQPVQRGLPPAEDRPVASPGETVPANPVPAQPQQSDGPAGPVVASAGVPGWRVDVEAARRLADIDAALAEKIAVACDAALARVLERAGSKVRSQAQKDRALAASLVGMDAVTIPAHLGRARVETFGPLTDLLADGYSRLRGQFTKWLADAAAQIAVTVVELLGLNPRSERAQQVRDQVTTRLASRTDTAWVTLAETLDQVAERAMFEPDPLQPRPPQRGEEASDTIISPREVADVLRVAGGGAVHQSPMRATTPGPGGYGTGPDVTGLLAEHGAVLLGWEWQYRGVEIPRAHPFAPWHTRLDHVRFATWTDPKLDTEEATAWIGPYYYPGDHENCRCRVVPILAAPELDDDTGGDILEQRLQEARRRNAVGDRVAADDDRAGRVGTTLQMERDVRDRITAGIAELRQQYIERNGS